MVGRFKGPLFTVVTQPTIIRSLGINSSFPLASMNKKTIEVFQGVWGAFEIEAWLSTVNLNFPISYDEKHFDVIFKY